MTTKLMYAIRPSTGPFLDANGKPRAPFAFDPNFWIDPIDWIDTHMDRMNSVETYDCMIHNPGGRLYNRMTWDQHLNLLSKPTAVQAYGELCRYTDRCWAYIGSVRATPHELVRAAEWWQTIGFNGVVLDALEFRSADIVLSINSLIRRSCGSEFTVVCEGLHPDPVVRRTMPQFCLDWHPTFRRMTNDLQRPPTAVHDDAEHIVALMKTPVSKQAADLYAMRGWTLMPWDQGWLDRFYGKDPNHD